jgi:hypothetical protein
VNAADKAIKLAEWHGVGVRLNASGDGLALEAEAAPPSDLIEVLREAKAEIVVALRRQAVVQWVNDRFVSSPPDVCAAGCGRPGLPLTPLSPVFVGEDQAWFHERCYRQWFERRCDEAARALWERWALAKTRASNEGEGDLLRATPTSSEAP